MLLGEVLGRDGRRYDLQLKEWPDAVVAPWRWVPCAGGRKAREYLVSEAMHALGVPPTRALAAVVPGEDVYRGAMEAGGVFTRWRVVMCGWGLSVFRSALDTEALYVG